LEVVDLLELVKQEEMAQFLYSAQSHLLVAVVEEAQQVEMVVLVAVVVLVLQWAL
jgi:hypothetical protein